jgi:hypothetical protein
MGDIDHHTNHVGIGDGLAGLGNHEVAQAIARAVNPGVSTKITWASLRVKMPRIALRVVWGFGEVVATFCQ